MLRIVGNCFWLLLAAFLARAYAADSEPLSSVAVAAMAKGKDASLNAFFARQLGIDSGNKTVPLKRLTIEAPTRTNVFNVSASDKRTIILFVREKNLTTYYLTDTSGRLKKAIVNDSSIQNGGLTNISLNRAEGDFKALKQLWTKHDSARRK